MPISSRPFMHSFIVAMTDLDLDGIFTIEMPSATVVAE